MNKIIIVRGIPASGKSTWAKAWVAEDPTHRIRFNWDDIRNMFGPYWVVERENTKILKVLRDTFINKMMEKEWDIVMDNMNLNPKEIEFYETCIEEYNKEHENKYSIEIKDFFIPVEECIRRDSLRPNPIGEKTIKQIWNKYRSTIINIECIKFSKSFIKDDIDINKPFAIIVDLDATIALNLENRPFYGKGCAEGIKDDTPIYPIIHILENYTGDIIFLTGREGTKEIKKETIKWVNKNIIQGENQNWNFIFRPIGDYSSGVEFKRNAYLNQIEPKYNIEFVLEDNSKVVKMFRDLNLLVLQPNEGKF